MRKSSMLIVTMVLVCFAIMAFNSNNVFAGNEGGTPGKLDTIQQTLDNQVVPKLGEVEPRIPISSLPYTISDSDSYYLTGNLTSTGDGIVVSADNVTIDLMGFSLTGTGSGRGIYMNGRSNVEIRNGTIRDFTDNGIYEASSDGTSHRVINVRAISNGQGINNHGIYLSGDNHLVKDCTAVSNANYGISVGNGCTVTGNTASDNRSYAIQTGSGCTITGNTCYDTQGRGISTLYGCTVINNTCHNNTSHGICVGGSSTVIANTARSNGNDGIHSVGSSLVSENNVHNNGDNGIGAEHTTMVVGNIARSNNTNGSATSAGISVANGCLVKGNTVLNNSQNNIYVSGDDSSIEENLVVGTNNGIYFDDSDNFYANNRASGNATNYAGSLPTGSGDGGGNVEF